MLVGMGGGGVWVVGGGGGVPALIEPIPRTNSMNSWV